eukprot:20187-Heterococcus_DN1.PRE.2
MLQQQQQQQQQQLACRAMLMSRNITAKIVRSSTPRTAVVGVLQTCAAHMSHDMCVARYVCVAQYAVMLMVKSSACR